MEYSSDGFNNNTTNNSDLCSGISDQGPCEDNNIQWTMCIIEMWKYIPKKWVYTLRRQIDNDGVVVMTSGRLFQTSGPAPEKDWLHPVADR